MATSSIGSGGMIDVNSIVSQLMSIERNPLTLINNKIKGIDTKLSEVGKLKAAMDKLRSAAVSLSGAGSWSAAKASSARPEVVEASAAAGALPGSYSLRVDALAQHLAHLDPRGVLARGYSITRNAAGQIVRDARTLAPGDGIHVELHHGSVDATVSPHND